jgi:hypothetical protein
VGILYTRLEALAAQGRVAEAESLMMQAANAEDPEIARLCLVRGLMRAGLVQDATAHVVLWVRQSKRPALIAQLLRAMPVTAALGMAGSSIPELAQVPDGLDGELQAICERYLGGGRPKCFLGRLPIKNEQNARSAFLKLDPDERLLFFHDWTFLENAKGGFAITNRRVIWKCLWEDPVSVTLVDKAPESISAVKTALSVGGQLIDIDDENLAEDIATAIREMVGLHSRVTIERLKNEIGGGR